MVNSTNDDDFLKIYASDNEMLQKVCQLLSTPKSNKIYNTCMDKQLNAKEIAKIIEGDDNPRLPGYVVHLKNMVDVGLLRVEEKEQKKKGHVLKFYKAVPFVIIAPPQHVEKAKKSKTLRNSFRTVFKEGVKFLAVGIASSITWLGMTMNQIQIPTSKIQVKFEDLSINSTSYVVDEISELDYSMPIFCTLIVIGTGLFLIWFQKK